MSNTMNESEYDFTLVIDGIDELDDSVLNALFEAGCDDATLAMRSGRVFMTFSRNAPSMMEGIMSAICDVKKSNVGAEVLRVDECNLVTQAEIARKSGISRQRIHQYITSERGPGCFPPPACDSADGVPMWYWCEVAYWLLENAYIKEHVAVEAAEVEAINARLEWDRVRRGKPKLVSEVERLFRSPCG